MLEKTIPSVFSLALGLKQKIIITPRDVSDKISTSIALTYTEHDTSILILDAVAADYASLRESYKIALSAYAVITGMIGETELFNIVNSLPDRIGVLLICSEVYEKIKDTYLEKTKARGVEVIVFGTVDFSSTIDASVLSPLPNVYAEKTYSETREKISSVDSTNQDNPITLTFHADGFYDISSKEVVNQVTRIQLAKDSLDFIDDILAIIALGCRLGISLYDIKNIFKC